MSVGHPVSKGEIDARSGDTTRGFQKLFGDVATMKNFLDQTADQKLIDLGYTTEEVTLLKSAYADLWQLTKIWTGEEALNAPKDFRTFVRQIWGVGSF